MKKRKKIDEKPLTGILKELEFNQLGKRILGKPIYQEKQMDLFASTEKETEPTTNLQDFSSVKPDYKLIHSREEHLNFIKEFEKDGGDGLSLEETNFILKAKSFTNYELINGDVRNTLLDFLKKNTSEKFSLIHLDMDVYEPTAFVLDKLFDRLVTGGLIVIDDYNTVEGATTAVDEFIVQHPNLKIERLPYNNIPIFIRKC